MSKICCVPENCTRSPKAEGIAAVDSNLPAFQVADSLNQLKSLAVPFDVFADLFDALALDIAEKLSVRSEVLIMGQIHNS